MQFTHTPLSFILSCIFFLALTSAQGVNQNQTCANACIAAQACDHQCVPGTTYDVTTNTNIYVDCLCQSGCLCNAEICLQCCEAAGVNGANADSCPFLNLWAANVLDYCSVEGTTPAKATPAKDCFVYGDDGNSSPTSTYISGSPFPSSVQSYIAGLLPLTNITVAASSLTNGGAWATVSPLPITGGAGSTSVSSQTTAKADITTGPPQTGGKAAATSTPQTSGKATTTPTSSSTTSAPAPTTSQPTASSQKSAAEGTWGMAAKGLVLLLALPLGFLVL